MEKLLPMEEIFEKLKRNGFQKPENQFPFARMKNLLKNKFTLDRKKVATARSIWKLGKKLVSISQKIRFY